MKCKYCNPKRIVFENKNLIAFLKEKPATTGHIVLVPKKHYTILEQVPEDVAGEMFYVANQLSSILFEVLGAEGTNIIIENGINQKAPHCSLNILPRKQNDNLNLVWEQKEPDKEKKEKMDVAEIKLKKACNFVIGKKEEKVEEVKEEKEEVKDSSWINKILTRLP